MKFPRRWAKVGMGGLLGGSMALGLLSSTVLAASVPDFTQDGFPSVVAKATIQPTSATTLHAGPITIAVPAGAFSTPVTFEVIENTNAYWQSKAPAGQTVVANFAFKVENPATSQLIGLFSKPVMFSVTGSQIMPSSRYYNVAANGAFALNPIPSKIVGDTLSHPIAGAPVGWVVTSPAAAATSPTTGLPIAPVMAGGVLLLGLGTYVLRKNPRSAR